MPHFRSSLSSRFILCGLKIGVFETEYGGGEVGCSFFVCGEKLTSR